MDTLFPHSTFDLPDIPRSSPKISRTRKSNANDNVMRREERTVSAFGPYNNLHPDKAHRNQVLLNNYPRTCFGCPLAAFGDNAHDTEKLGFSHSQRTSILRGTKQDPRRFLRPLFLWFAFGLEQFLFYALRLLSVPPCVTIPIPTVLLVALRVVRRGTYYERYARGL